MQKLLRDFLASMDNFFALEVVDAKFGGGA